MANDSLFLVCRGCRQMRKIYKHFGYADPEPYISGRDLETFLVDHLYCTGFNPDGFHLPEHGFDVKTEHVLMRERADDSIPSEQKPLE